MLAVASSSRLGLTQGARHVSRSRCSQWRPPPFLAPAMRFKSTLSVLDPSSSAEREVPTPILFLTASRWTSTKPAKAEFAAWVTHFQSQGYTTMLLDLDPEQDVALIKDSAGLMDVFEKEAQTVLLSHNTPFPPAMIAKGPASLIAQTYVSSRPLTALQLIDPPITVGHLRRDRPDLLPNELKEFDFEATFPVRVVWSQAELQRQQEVGVSWYDVHRIEHLREEEADESLDRYTYDTDEAGAKEAQEWLEGEVGVLEMENSDQDNSGFDEDDEADFDEDIYDADAEDAEPVKASAGNLMEEEWFKSGSYTLHPGARKYPLTLDENHLTEKFVRGSGPGGQAINKISSNVQLVHTPTGTRVTCQDTRSRDRNRELARRKLSRVLERLVLGESGGSRIDREIDKKRRQKSNKKKKQKRRANLKLQLQGEADTS